MKMFGYFKGLPYDLATEDFEKYKDFKNEVSKARVIAHIESLERWLTSGESSDIFTGEELHRGLFEDGDFVFPLEFLHYYKNYDIGIPYDYEEYLVSVWKKDLD